MPYFGCLFVCWFGSHPSIHLCVSSSSCASSLHSIHQTNQPTKQQQQQQNPYQVSTKTTTKTMKNHSKNKRSLSLSYTMRVVRSFFFRTKKISIFFCLAPGLWLPIFFVDFFLCCCVWFEIFFFDKIIRSIFPSFQSKLFQKRFISPKN